MTKPPVIALWLDSAEPELFERLLAAGVLPHLARLRAEGAYGRLHSVRFGVTEVSYAMLGTGCWPSTLGYWQQCAFEPATYSGRLATLAHFERHRPFYALGPDYRVVFFDVPQMPVRDDVHGLQVAAWGAHAPHVPRAARPAGLLDELLARHPVPQMERQSGYQVDDADSLRGIHRALLDGLARRSAVLLDLWRRAGGRPWDLVFAAIAELHTGGHAFWPHPDLRAALDEAGGESLLTDVYRAADALVGEILAAAGPDVQVAIFSVEGMRRNDADNGSMLFLPELLVRYAFPGRRAFDFSAPPAHEPPPEDLAGWYFEVWRHRVRPGRVGAWLRRRLGPARAAAWEARLGLTPTPYPALPGEERYLPATWFWPYHPHMPAFALPGFSDGFVRVNVRGRERHGRVAPRAFGRVCDEITALLYGLVDERGRAVVDEVIRTRGHPSEAGPGRPPADLVVRWSPHCGREAQSPRLGRFGPVVPMRLGNHTPNGFLLARGPGFAPGTTLPDGRVVDLAPTLLAMVGAAPPPMDGRSLLEAAAPAPAGRSAAVLRDPAQPELSPARLAVVMCVRDEQELILANLLYHRALGVERAYVYLDRCTDRTAELAGSVRGVRLLTVSPAERERFQYVGDLQAACMTHALALARREGFGWLLALDPDEFASGLERDAPPAAADALAAGDLRRLVRHLPPEALQVLLATKECVPADLGETAPFWRQQYFQAVPVLRQIRDPITNETRPWEAFLGHDAGKPLLRTTANAEGYHSHRWTRRQPAPDGQARRRRAVDDPLPSVTAGSILHFNVVSGAHWRAKYRKVADEPAFWPSGHPVELPREWWKRASRALDAAAAARYFARWIALPDVELGALHAAGRLSRDGTVEAVLRAAGCLEGDRVVVPAKQRARMPARPERTRLLQPPARFRIRRPRVPERYRDAVPKRLAPAYASVHRVFPADMPRTDLRGFYPVEASEGEGFCWAMPRAEVRLTLPPGAYELAVHTRHLAPLWSGRLRAFVGERPLGEPTPLDAGGAVRFAVDATALPPGDVWLRLEAPAVDTARWPGEWRTLGAPIFELTFTPALAGAAATRTGVSRLRRARRRAAARVP